MTVTQFGNSGCVGGGSFLYNNTLNVCGSNGLLLTACSSTKIYLTLLFWVVLVFITL
jgi:hypothetical protein